MKNTVLVVAGLLATAAATYHAAGVPQPALPAIGFVDLGRVLSKDPLYAKSETEITSWKDDKQKALDQGLRDLEAKNAELDSFQPGSEQGRALAEEITGRQATLKFRLDALNAELESRRALALREAYGRIRKACEDVRRAEGLQAVLQYNPLPPSGQTRDQVAAEIVPRSVLALDPAQVDITDAVLKILQA